MIKTTVFYLSEKVILPFYSSKNNLKSLFLLFFYLLTEIVVAQVVTLGTGTATTTSPQVSPYVNNYGQARKQMIITAAELIAAGAPVGGGLIDLIGFDGSANGDNKTFNLTIQVRHTNLSSLCGTPLTSSANWDAGGFTVLHNGNVNSNAVSGWRHYGNSTNFCWNGVCNLLVQICNTNGTGGYLAPTIRYSTFTPDITRQAYGTGGSGSACTFIPSAPLYYAYNAWRPNMRVTFIAGACTPGEITSGSCTPLAGVCTPLPILLTSFSANHKNNSVVLNWTTSTEINNDYFTIERSKDMKNWEEVSIIMGAGNSNTDLNYTETDVKPFEGVSYYRLKQTDFDGRFEYSNAVYVRSSKLNTFELYPNPAVRGERVYLSFDEADNETMHISIRDLQGKEVVSYNVADFYDNNEIDIPIEYDIPSGMYLIIATSENRTYRQKLLID